MTIFMKLLFTILMLFNLYLFITINDSTRADIIHQSELIPARIGEVMEMIDIAIQERANS